MKCVLEYFIAVKEFGCDLIWGIVVDEDTAPLLIQFISDDESSFAKNSVDKMSFVRSKKVVLYRT